MNKPHWRDDAMQVVPLPKALFLLKVQWLLAVESSPPAEAYLLK